MRLIKQIPLDEPSKVRMDSIIKEIDKLIRPSFSQLGLISNSDDNLARGIEIFMYASLDLENSMLKEPEQLILANDLKTSFSSYINQVQTLLMPLLKHAVNRGVPKERILEYCVEGFIERLLIVYPKYIPIMLGNVFKAEREG